MLDLKEQIRLQLLNKQFYSVLVPHSIDRISISNPTFYRLDPGRNYFFY